MPQAYRVHRQIQPDGTLKLENLPIQPGEAVEVIVRAEERRVQRHYPFRGKPLVCNDPIDPMAEPLSRAPVHRPA
jgi:hypothetical protein